MHFAVWFLFSTVPGFVSASCAHGTFLHPRAEGKVEVNNFGYSGATGPANWFLLDPVANMACATGTRQSPINMVCDQFPLLSGADLSIQLSNLPDGAPFENLGTTVEVVAEGAGTMTIPQVGNFTLQQFHFHLPSEHLDNGRSMAMEMHMVWENPTGQIAVIGTYIQTAEGAVEDDDFDSDDKGDDDALQRRSAKMHQRQLTRRQDSGRVASRPTELLETVLGRVDEISQPGSVAQTAALDMSELLGLLTAGQFQYYSGSLTTPPCSEGVNWLVSTQKLAIRASTFTKARNVIGFNARFPQNDLGEQNVLQLSAKLVAGLDAPSGPAVL